MGLRLRAGFRAMAITAAAAALDITAAAAAVAITAALAAVAITTAAAADAPPVDVARATVRDVPVTVRGLGAVQASEAVTVHARVDGVIERIAFTEGQTVKPGDLLAVIDARPYRAALQQAQAVLAADGAKLANAARDLKRTSALVQANAASRQQLDTNGSATAQLAAQIQGDQAAVAAAQLNVDFCNVVAPFEGRVGLRPVDVGTLVHPSDALGIATLSKVTPIAVVFTLPQDVLPRVRQAQSGGAQSGGASSGGAQAGGALAVDALAADGAVLAEGSLLAADNAIDAQSGTIKLKAIFANADEALWPGQFVTARLRLATLRDAVTVPSTAVQRGPEGTFVWRVRDDRTAEHAPVTLAQDDGALAVVRSGLGAGETVVVAGQSRVTRGQKVAPQDAKS